MSDKFSRRIGAIPANRVIQIESMDAALRASLWNVLVETIQDSEKWRDVAKNLASQFFKVPSDEVPYQWYDCRDWVKRRFMGLEWNRVYDLVEYMSIDSPILFQRHRELVEIYNSILERENSGYRFIGEQLTPVSNAIEVTEVEDALASATEYGLKGANEHLRVALGLLGKRPEPDYRNCIKEAISAVESVVKVIAGDDRGGVSQALDVLSESTPLHGGFKAALKSLYGYTSDDSGIRHALLEEASVSYEEAKFMLIVCSAFVNFLIGKAATTGALSRRAGA